VVCQFLTGLTQAGPVMIFFEDAHWLDAQTRDLLRFIGARVEHLPLLFLVAQREVEDKLNFKKNQILNLAPLAAGETNTLVAHLLITDLAQVIHDQSRGNPLFVEEITRWFQRLHHISAGELRDVLQTSNFLQKLVLSQVESLPEEQREIAMLASVAGLEFHTSEVQALLPATLDPVTLSNHLRGLARTQLITLAEAGVDARYVFPQNLVRDVLYNSLPFEKRRELHGKLADFLHGPLTRWRALRSKLAAVFDTRPGPDAAQQARIVAEHYERAERWGAAAQCCLLAGDHARAQKVHAQAAADYAHGLVDLEKPPSADEGARDPAVKYRLLLGQGDMALLLADFLTAAAAFEAARANAPALETPGADLALAYRLALALPSQRRAEEAEAQLGAALEKLEQPPIEHLAVMAWLTWRAGKASAADWLARCEALQAGADPRLGMLLASWRGQWEAARAGCQDLGLSVGAVYAALRGGEQLLRQGDAAGALAAYRQAQEACQIAEDDLYYIGALSLFRQAEIHWRVGDANLARAALQQAETVLEKITAAWLSAEHPVIRQAVKLLGRSRAKTWPAWPLQNFEDRLYIRLLFLTTQPI
jgi:hypothetical protein